MVLWTGKRSFDNLAEKNFATSPKFFARIPKELNNLSVFKKPICP